MIRLKSLPLLFLFPVLTAISAAPPLKLQDSDRSLLNFLHATPITSVFQKGRLLLGDSKAVKDRQLFFIHNRSKESLMLDFTEGHIGASGGLLQYMEKGQWLAYIYIKNKDLRKTISGHQERTTWECSNSDGQAIDCQKNLVVYKVPYDLQLFARSNSLVHYKLLTALKNQQYAWWLSDPQDHLINLFLNRYAVNN